MKQIFIILSLTINMLMAQDANYWSHQYGSRSTLLGGAVIGSVLDLSGTYYNPGGLSLIDDPDVLLAAKVFEYPNYLLESDIRGGSEIASSTLRPAPSIVATMFDFDWQGGHRIGISVFDRYDVFFNLKNTFVESDFNQDGDELISNLQVRQELSELWGGLSWSYKIQRKFGIGITQYFTFRFHNTNINKSTQVIAQNQYLLNGLNTREYIYSSFGLLWKFGATFDFKGLTIGLTATTPNLQYYGNGSSGLNKTYIEIDSLINNATRVAAAYQSDVVANYRSPWSLGVGTTLKIPRTSIYISAEWFSEVGKYAVIEPVNFNSQIGDDTLSNGVTHELEAILNLGIGIEYNVTEDITINLSFTTDFSAFNPESDTNLSIAAWDTYHFFTGSSFNIGSSRVTLGFGYAFGSHTMNESDFLDPELFTYLATLENVVYKYQNFKLLIGFSI